MQPQITINLLPEQSGKRRAGQAKTAAKKMGGGGGGRQVPMPQIAVFALGGLAGLLVIATGTLMYMAHRAEGRLAAVQAQWHTVEPQRRAVEQLKQERQALDQQIQALEEAIGRRLAWSERLNRLSDVVPDGIWFTEMTIDSRNEVILEGMALELTSGAGMQVVSQLLIALQAQPVFTSVFGKIALQSVTRRSVGSANVLEFIIICTPSA